MLSGIEYEYLLRETEKGKYPVLLSGEWVFKNRAMRLLLEYETKPVEFVAEYQWEQFFKGAK